MTAPLRPMLAFNDPVKPSEIPVSPERPIWLSPKLDGIRCLQANSASYSRTLKHIPNNDVQRRLGHPDLDGFDGELVVGAATAPNVYNATTSGVMSRDGQPDFTYYVFDRWDAPGVGFRTRYSVLRRGISGLKRRGFPIELVPQILCRSAEEIEDALGVFYELGYEGGIARNFDGKYKHNRSTLKEGLLLKLKDSIDSEILITGFEEMMHNLNTATIDERGLTKRSTHKENKVPAGTLGRITGIDVHTEKPITIGTGKMTAAQKLEVWQNQAKYLQTFAKYRYAKHGNLNLPRHPRWIGWRDPIDM